MYRLMLEDFGISYSKFFLQLAIVFAFNLWATIRVVRSEDGTGRVGWLLFVWLVPFLGAIVALLGLRKK